MSDALRAEVKEGTPVATKMAMIEALEIEPEHTL